MFVPRALGTRGATIGVGAKLVTDGISGGRDGTDGLYMSRCLEATDSENVLDRSLDVAHP